MFVSRLREGDEDPEVEDKARLAIALNSLSNRLALAERHGEALAPIEEAVALRHQALDPENVASVAELAGSLNNLASRLARQDRHEDALAAIEESVETLPRDSWK